jgi:hypothetical protein
LYPFTQHLETFTEEPGEEFETLAGFILRRDRNASM